MTSQPPARPPNDSRLLMNGYGSQTIGMVRAIFDLYEDQCATTARNDVHLANRCAHAAGENAPTFDPQHADSRRLGKQSLAPAPSIACSRARCRLTVSLAWGKI